MTNPNPANCGSLPLYTNQHFTVEPCATCAIPGYLIVIPRIPTASLSEMNSDPLTTLGTTLALATRVIEAVVRPERVYCTLFAEQTRQIHFHLFPRTAELASQFLAANPEEREISCPRLMDWARRALQQPLSGNDAVTEKLRAAFKGYVSDSLMSA